MKFVIFLCFPLFLGLVEATSCNCKSTASADLQRTLHLEKAVEKLESRVKKFVKQLGNFSDYAEETSIHLHAMGKEIKKLEDPACSSGQFSCEDKVGRTGACVNRLLVCDGVKDCRSGRDEDPSLCSVDFQINSQYKTMRGLHDLPHLTALQWTGVLDQIKHIPWFPGYPKIRYWWRGISYSQDGKYTLVHGSVKTEGYYDYVESAFRTVNVAAGWEMFMGYGAYANQAYGTNQYLASGEYVQIRPIFLFRLGCFTREPGINTVYEELQIPRQDARPWTFYFGDFGDNVDRCERACREEFDCHSYTLHLKAIGTEWAGQCYGRNKHVSTAVAEKWTISGTESLC